MNESDRSCRRNRGRAIQLGIFTASIIGMGLIIALRFGEWLGPASLSATFSRYERLSPAYSTNWAAIFVISNTGPKTVIFRGVGASSEQQLVQILGLGGWADAGHPWLSPGAALFALAPQEMREVPVLIGTNQPWRVGFRFRERGLVDYCPRFLWQVMPGRFGNPDSYQELWTEPVKGRN